MQVVFGLDCTGRGDRPWPEKGELLLQRPRYDDDTKNRPLKMRHVAESGQKRRERERKKKKKKAPVSMLDNGLLVNPLPPIPSIGFESLNQQSTRAFTKE